MLDTTSPSGFRISHLDLEGVLGPWTGGIMLALFDSGKNRVEERDAPPGCEGLLTLCQCAVGLLPPAECVVAQHCLDTAHDWKDEDEDGYYSFLRLWHPFVYGI